MSTTAVVLIGLALIFLAVAGFVVYRRQQEQKLEEKRTEAGELRQEADTRARKAEQARLQAEEQADRARKEQEAAEERRRQAAEVDPDIDTDAEDAGRRNV